MRFIIPEQAASHFHLHEGDTVGDFGAGSGFFEPVLSRMVGSTGKVYAFEIQKQLVEKLAETARIEHLDNVEVLWCDLESADGCKLAEGTLDAGVMANTLFQIEDKQTALTEVARMVRTGGKFFLLDWTESFGGMGPQPGDIVPSTDAQALVEQHGFTYERTFPAGEHHYGLAFRKQ